MRRSLCGPDVATWNARSSGRRSGSGRRNAGGWRNGSSSSSGRRIIRRRQGRIGSFRFGSRRSGRFRGLGSRRGSLWLFFGRRGFGGSRRSCRACSPRPLQGGSRNRSGNPNRRSSGLGGNLWLGRRRITSLLGGFLVVATVSVVIAILSLASTASASSSAGSPTAAPSTSRVSIASSASPATAATVCRSFFGFVPLVDGFPRFFHPCRSGFLPPYLDFFP
mmetsp:Transcript_27067/g.74312  ORF Transcript_27067/g.74312 Transcript_27067/m.74312 type:complete len:221 (-) Transcript_27067:7-669(-)